MYFIEGYECLIINLEGIDLPSRLLPTSGGLRIWRLKSSSEGITWSTHCCIIMLLEMLRQHKISKKSQVPLIVDTPSFSGHDIKAHISAAEMYFSVSVSPIPHEFDLLSVDKIFSKIKVMIS